MRRAICLTALAIALSGCLPPPAAKKKVYTRDEFTALVRGKTEAEVISAVGRPDDTADLAGLKLWTYRHVTTDPVTSKIDSSAQLAFGEGGKVVRVSY